MASNAAIQHFSFVLISVIIAVWGALGLDTAKCPMDNPQIARDAIFWTYTWLNGLWLFIYAVALLFYPIKGMHLAKIVGSTRAKLIVQNIKGSTQVLTRVVEKE